MSAGSQVQGTSDDEANRTKFVTVMRGYDRVEVDEYVRDTRRSTQHLRAELDDTRRRCGQLRLRWWILGGRAARPLSSGR